MPFIRLIYPNFIFDCKWARGDVSLGQIFRLHSSNCDLPINFNWWIVGFPPFLYGFSSNKPIFMTICVDFLNFLSFFGDFLGLPNGLRCWEGLVMVYFIDSKSWNHLQSEIATAARPRRVWRFWSRRFASSEQKFPDFFNFFEFQLRFSYANFGIATV